MIALRKGEAFVQTEQTLFPNVKTVFVNAVQPISDLFDTVIQQLPNLRAAQNITVPYPLPVETEIGTLLIP